jgi:hypothetical protein
MLGRAAVMTSASFQAIGALLEAERRTISRALLIWVISLQDRRRELCGTRSPSQEEDLKISLGCQAAQCFENIDSRDALLERTPIKSRSNEK